MLNAVTMSWPLWYGRIQQERVDRGFEDLQSIMYCGSNNKTGTTSLIKTKTDVQFKATKHLLTTASCWRVRPMSWSNAHKYYATVRLVDIWSQKGHSRWRGISYHCYRMRPTLWSTLALDGLFSWEHPFVRLLPPCHVSSLPYDKCNILFLLIL